MHPRLSEKTGDISDKVVSKNAVFDEFFKIKEKYLLF